MSLRRIFDRLAGHDRKHDQTLGYLKIIDKRLKQMTKATDNEALAIANLTSIVSATIGKINDLTAQINAAVKDDDTDQIEQHTSAINDLAARLQMAVGPAQAAHDAPSGGGTPPETQADGTSDHTTGGTVLGAGPDTTAPTSTDSASTSSTAAPGAPSTSTTADTSAPAPTPSVT
jgi:hypothetical protein